jgi:hypothetical protein
MKLAYLFALLIGTPAVAHHIPEHLLVQEQMTCGGYADMSARLGTEWGEYARFGGLDQKGMFTVLFVSESGSWTVLMIRPDGKACVAAAGSNGQINDAPPQGIDG